MAAEGKGAGANEGGNTVDGGADDIRSERLKRLPTYLFEELASIRRAREAEGKEVIDLSIGDPDLGAPAVAVEALARHAADAGLHRYPPDAAIEAFTGAACDWMRERYDVDLDPACEMLPVIGTKEGIALLPLAVMNPGDLALVPDPGYPVYSRGVWFAGGRVEWMPLEEKRGFLPEVALIEKHRPRLVYLNYPNNPTSAVAGVDFYAAAVDVAGRTGSFIANDAAYSEIAFGGYVAPSILQAKGARERAIEFHSFSKTFSMAGWRVGFAAGNRHMIASLRTLKSNVDSGVFGAVLMAAATVIREGWDAHRQMISEYGRRRAILFDGLKACGISYHESPATLYIWARVPGGRRSMEFARALLEEAGILVTPGVGFGDSGEGYFRISITCPTDQVEIAGKRLHEVSRAWKGSATWTR
jgi:LL-diaminopimelate aminotransferase